MSDSTPCDFSQVQRSTFVESVHHHAAIDSTNSECLRLLATESVVTPLLVITDEQTRGRGRGANVWWSSQGALTFSLVVNSDDVQLARSLWPQASITTGLSVCLALESLVSENDDIRLKWPNDVHLNQRKVCGILIEPSPDRHECLVIGIGLNVNNSLHGAPIELTQTATSICDSVGHSVNRETVLIAVLQELERQFARLAASDASLAPDWSSRCALHGSLVEVESGNRLIRGQCQGIDQDGALLIVTESGVRERLFAGVAVRIVE